MIILLYFGYRLTNQILFVQFEIMDTECKSFCVALTAARIALRCKKLYFIYACDETIYPYPNLNRATHILLSMQLLTHAEI